MKEAVILAGGLGTRLRSVVGDLPKPMAPIGEKPFLEILLAQLAGNGIERVILSLGYRAELIRTHFGGNYEGLPISYVVENHPLGTGGAIRACLAQASADPVLVLNGDTFLDLDFLELEHFWAQRRRPTIVARKVADVGRFGALEISGDQIVSFHEKQTRGPGLINAGCYVFSRDIASKFPDAENFAIERDFLMEAVKHTHFDAFETSAKFIDIGIPDDYLRAQVELAGT